MKILRPWPILLALILLLLQVFGAAFGAVRVYNSTGLVINTVDQGFFSEGFRLSLSVIHLLVLLGVTALVWRGKSAGRVIYAAWGLAAIAYAFALAEFALIPVVPPFVVYGIIVALLYLPQARGYFR